MATLAMLTGVLVIAFPVSVFSDLWQSELRKGGALSGLLAALDDNNNDDDNDDDDDDDENDNNNDDNNEANASRSPQVSSLDSTGQLQTQNVMLPLPRNEEVMQKDSAVTMGQDSDHSHLHVSELAGAMSIPAAATTLHQTTATAAITSRSTAATAAAASAAFDQRQHHQVESNLVVMRKDDLVELATHMQSIHESQKQIRHILRRYRIPFHHKTMSSFSDHGGSSQS